MSLKMMKYVFPISLLVITPFLLANGFTLESEKIHWGNTGLLISIVLTLAIAVANAYAARGAYKAAKATEEAAEKSRRAIQAQLLNSYLDEYRSIEMLKSLGILSATHIKIQNASKNLKDNDLNMKVIEFRLNANIHRRYVKEYFFNAADLFMHGYVDDMFMSAITRRWGFKLVFEVIKPWEEDAGMIRKEVGDDKRYAVLLPFYEKIKDVPLERTAIE